MPPRLAAKKKKSIIWNILINIHFKIDILTASFSIIANYYAIFPAVPWSIYVKLYPKCNCLKLRGKTTFPYINSWATNGKVNSIIFKSAVLQAEWLIYYYDMEVDAYL